MLALASAPTYNPGVYSGRVTMKKLAAQGLTSDTAKAKNYPALNRALVGSYPPGSTFKPVTALAAMQQHLVSPYAPQACTGTYTAPEDRGHQVFKNWDPYVNAAIDLPTALAISCDTYFYELGNKFYELPASYGHPLQAWAIELRVRPPHRASTSGRRRAACCRRPSGGSGRSPRRPIRAAGASTASGSRATRSSSRSGRRTCSSRRCRWRASTR